MTKGSGWADLPQDVVQHLVSLLKTKDFCQVWLLSRNWASCSRQITTPPMIIPSSQATLSGKLATLASWTQAGRFANSEFSFQTDKSMTVLELRNTIKALTQGSLTKCNLLVELRCVPGLNFDWQQHLEDAHQTADFAQQLRDKNRVELRITLTRSTGNVVLPAEDVIHALKRFVHVFDTYSIPTEQPAATLCQWTEECDLGLHTSCHRHVTALEDSSIEVCTVRVFCGLDRIQNLCDNTWSYDALVAAVATMTHLTKLHLSLSDAFYSCSLNLEPLACLTLLQILALQCCDLCYGRECTSVCCQGVLSRNKHLLRCVILTGPWTVATYNALRECSKLEILSISISELDIDQAQAFAKVSACSFRLTLHQQLEPNVLAAFKHSQPQIHMLTAWGTDQNSTLRLPELSSLQELTLMRFLPFRETVASHASNLASDMQSHYLVSGEAFKCCHMVTKLTLIDCPGISNKGLKNIVEKALPALQNLSIQATRESGWQFLVDSVVTVRFDTDILHALCLGSKLCSIDLRGVSGLTTDALLQCKFALHQKQCQGNAPSSIDLLLPLAARLDKAVFSLETSRPMTLLPNIFRTADCGDAEQIAIVSSVRQY